MTFKQFRFYIQANWIKTLYFNFKLLPFREALKCPVLLFGKCDLSIGDKAKMMFLGGGAKFATSFIGNTDAPTVGKRNRRPNRTNLYVYGTLIFHGAKHFIGNGTTICVYPNAKLKFCNHVWINNNTRIVTQDKIEIGDYTRIAWDSQVMDTDFHYMVDDNGVVNSRKTKEIYIGKHCWIGNRVTIQKGTRLSDFSIVASNSLVNKDFSSIEKGTFVGIPARQVATNKTRLLNYAYEYALDDFFLKNKDINKVKVNIDECYTYFSKDNLEIIPIE